MLYSFDVFDTLITRKVTTPKGIFALMQKVLLSSPEYQGIQSYIRENFYELRIHSEELARHQFQQHGAEDIRLDQIYEAMGTMGSISKQELSDLKVLEEMTEIENSVGVAGNIAAVKKLVLAGERVILISDMYLSAKIIRTLLVNADAIFSDIPLYVSSEYRKGKYSGNLFTFIHQIEQIDYTDWYHIGDNAVSDIKIPRMLGINVSYPARIVSPLPIEKWIVNGREKDEGLHFIVDTARLYRIKKGVSNGPAVIGASVAGPILISYVRWVLNESVQRGFKRLYFIARDGYILKRMAEIIIEKEKLPIEISYIYGSRKAWRFPSYDGKKNSLITMLKWAYPQKIQSVKALAKLLQVKAEDLFVFLPGQYKTLDARLSFLVVSALIRELDSREDFRNWYFEQQKENRHLAVRYLQQEIDVSDDSFAFVELGGGGLTQSCMANLMAEFYSGRIKTFFFKMDSVNSWSNCDFYNFMPSFLASNLVVEMICRADHGQTEGYVEKDDRIIPVLKEGEGEAIIAHGYTDYIAGILGFTKQFIELNAEKQKIRFDLLLKYMEYVAFCPDSEVLDFFADMPNSLTGIEKKVYGFAPRLTKDDLRKIFLIHGNEYCPWDIYYNGTDIDYGLRRLNTFDRKRLVKYQNKRWVILNRFRRLWKRDLVKHEKVVLFDGIVPWLRGRVVIYGAGKIGQNIYGMLKHDGVNIVAWIDKDFKKLQKQGVPVTGEIAMIRDLAYETIIIAIKNEGIVEKVTDELTSLGVKKECVFVLADVWENYLLV